MGFFWLLCAPLCRCLGSVLIAFCCFFCCVKAFTLLLFVCTFELAWPDCSLFAGVGGGACVCLLLEYAGRSLCVCSSAVWLFEALHGLYVILLSVFWLNVMWVHSGEAFA